MLMILTCSNGWVRVFNARDCTVAEARSLIGRALMTCDLTARPAYREMIDTLDWGAIL